jgi:hypothetical protein
MSSRKLAIINGSCLRIGKALAAAARLAPAAWLLLNFNRPSERNHFPAPKKPA